VSTNPVAYMKTISEALGVENWFVDEAQEEEVESSESTTK